MKSQHDLVFSNSFLLAKLVVHTEIVTQVIIGFAGSGAHFESVTVAVIEWLEF